MIKLFKEIYIQSAVVYELNIDHSDHPLCTILWTIINAFPNLLPTFSFLMNTLLSEWDSTSTNIGHNELMTRNVC